MKKEISHSSTSLQGTAQKHAVSVEQPLEYSVFCLLKKYQCRLSTAESATGGMLAATLINVPGISEFFEEGYVTYSDAAKVKMIHVPEKIINTYGVVSSETACAMADAAAQTAGVDAALSVTGVAGPDGGTKACPVGTVYIGCHLYDKTVAEHFLFEGDRQTVRKAAVDASLQLLIAMFAEKGKTL